MSTPYDHDPYPNVKEVEQLETEEPAPVHIPPISVVVDEIHDIARTLVMPNRDLTMSYVVVKDGPAVSILPTDPRRSRLTLMPQLNTGDTNTSIYFGRSKEELDGGGGCPWPTRSPNSAPAPPFTINSGRGIWAKLLKGDAATCTVGYVAEYWAD